MFSIWQLSAKSGQLRSGASAFVPELPGRVGATVLDDHHLNGCSERFFVLPGVCSGIHAALLPCRDAIWAASNHLFFSFSRPLFATVVGDSSLARYPMIMGLLGGRAGRMLLLHGGRLNVRLHLT